MDRVGAYMMVGALFLGGCTGLETGQSEEDVIDGQAGDPPPYYVGLSWSGSSSPFCGGTLIEDDIVLTAAHCVKGDRKYVKVTFPTRLREDSWRWESETVSAIIAHDGHEQVGDGATDVALLLLDEEAPNRSHGKKVKTIRRVAETPTEGSLEIVGFGNASNFGSLWADDFQVGEAAITPDCRHDNALCLRSDDARISSGDSGGPVVARQWNGPRLAGVVSGTTSGHSYHAPVADLEGWLDEKIEVLRSSAHNADVSTISAIFEAHCYHHPFEFTTTDDAGWVQTRIDDIALTRSMVEVDRASFETANETLQAGQWEEGEGCSIRLPDDTFMHRRLAFHPETKTVRFRAYVTPPDDGPRRYFEVLGGAEFIPKVGAVAADQTWLSLGMAESSGSLVEPSGARFQVQPRGDLRPASAVPASSRAIVRVGETEVRLYNRDDRDWVWWSSPLIGMVEAPVTIVALTRTAGEVSVALSLEGDQLLIDVSNARSAPLVAWELTCGSSTLRFDKTYGPFMPETHPEVARIEAEATVRAEVDADLRDGLPSDFSCKLNGIDVPLTLR